MSEQTVAAVALTDLPNRRRFFKPHRIVMLAVVAILVFCVVWFMRWDWLPKYSGRLVSGVGVTLMMLFSTAILGLTSEKKPKVVDNKCANSDDPLCGL